MYVIKTRYINRKFDFSLYMFTSALYLFYHSAVVNVIIFLISENVDDNDRMWCMFVYRNFVMNIHDREIPLT